MTEKCTKVSPRPIAMRLPLTRDVSDGGAIPYRGLTLLINLINNSMVSVVFNRG
jgi:hypothetical protein